MNEASAASAPKTIQIKHWNGYVLYECEILEGIESGMALRHALEKAVNDKHDLSGADLRGADLPEQKNDFWEILLHAPNEIAGLRAALVEGRVDGSTYEGACACLVGTIANLRGAVADTMEGIKPDSGRPAEQWFMGIRRGDTPETNRVSAISVQWLDEFAALLAAAKGETAKAEY